MPKPLRKAMEAVLERKEDERLKTVHDLAKNPVWVKNYCGTLSDGAHMGGGLNGQDVNSGRILVHSDGSPRRLTVVECERLQGIPDNHTQVPYNGRKNGNCPDGPRFRAIANTMTVPVMAWIGERIEKETRKAWNDSNNKLAKDRPVWFNGYIDNANGAI